jgi:hypothetical protein
VKRFRAPQTLRLYALSDGRSTLASVATSSPNGWMNCQVMTRVRYGGPDSAGYVKQPDLLRLRAVERTDRLGGGLQQYLAAFLREIRLSFRR